MHSNELNQYGTRLRALTIKIGKNSSPSSEKKSHLVSSSFEQRPDADKGDHAHSGDDQNRLHYPTNMVQLGQGSPENERAVMLNLDRVMDQHEQRANSRHSYKEVKELSSQATYAHIDIIAMKETLPTTKNNDLMMDFEPQVSALQEEDPSTIMENNIMRPRPSTILTTQPQMYF